MSARPELRGARWSAAVRCIAKAEHQALDVPGDDTATSFLEPFFARGVNAADNWVQQLQRNDPDLLTEVSIPWGPGNIWHGHADIVMPQSQVVLEAYHSVGGVFREEKALQVAFYAGKLGPDFKAMLHALDTTELLPDDGGFAVTPYAVDIHGLADQVHDIEERVIAAFQAGAVNPADKVSDTPFHPECKQCPFRDPCHADYVPPPIEEVPAMADVFDRLVLAQSNAAHLRAAAKKADEFVRSLRETVRPYAPPGRSVTAGGVQVKRVEVAPRRSFRISDYEKAGHLVTPTMRDFTRESDEPGERWYVTRVDS